MKTPIACALVMLGTMTAATAQPLSREDCREFGSALTDVAETIQRQIESHRRMPASQLRPRITEGEAAAALERYFEAQRAFVASGDAMVAAMQDLAYQMTLCGR